VPLTDSEPWGAPRRCAPPYAFAMAALVIGTSLLLAPTPGTAAALAPPATVHCAAGPPDGDGRPAVTHPSCPVAPRPNPPSVPSSGWELADDLAWAPSSPPAAATGEGAGLAGDAPSATAVLFGGAVNGTLSASTELYNQSTGVWTTLAPATGPSARSDFAFGADPELNEAVLFGGVVNATAQRVDASTWIFDFAARSWTNVSSSLAPPPREDAAFAVDPTGGFALLFGGVDPDYSPTSSLTYRDLWRLDLGTYAWTEVTVAGAAAPPALQGAELAWDPDLALFQLFGGCYPCSSAVWDFDPVNSTWWELAAPAGTPPSAREDGAWTFDPVRGTEVLFGGTDGVVDYADTFEYEPGANAWVTETAPGGPSARASPAATWLDVTANETLLLSGGTGVTAPDLWQLAPVSNMSVEVDNASSRAPIAGAFVDLDAKAAGRTSAAGVLNLTDLDPTETNLSAIALGYAGATATFWLPPNASVVRAFSLAPVPPGRLTVRVVNASGVPVPGAAVTAVTLGIPDPEGPLATLANGTAEFFGLPTALPVPNTTVTVTHALDHAANATVAVPPGGAVAVTVVLASYASLDLEVIGELANDTDTPVAHALILENLTSLGTTDDEGWLNTTSLVPDSARFSITADGFDPALADLLFPYSGVVVHRIYLSGVPFGAMEVTVVDGVTLQPVPEVELVARSNLSLSSVSAGTIGLTNLSGEALLPLPQAIYSLTASAAEYLATTTPSDLGILSGRTLNVTLALTPLPGATVDVLVHDARSGAPITSAEVAVEYATTYNTSGLGWANFTNVHFGPIEIVVSHPGYAPNDTLGDFFPNEIDDRYLVNLTPLPPTSALPTPGGALPNLVAGGAAFWPFLVLFGLVAGGTALYLFALRIPRRGEGAGPP